MGGVRRAAAAATIALVALAGVQGITAHSQSDPATLALNYLAGQQRADGSIPGFDPTSTTEDYVIAATAAGEAASTLQNGTGSTALEYLATNVTAASADALHTGKLIEAVVAAGDDPTDFAGSNLISKLEGTLDTSGVYGSGEGDYGYAFTQALAILGLHSAGISIPADALSYMHSVQGADGGWEYSAGWGEDTNSTAMMLLALDAAGDHSSDASTLTWLHAQEETSGGFPYQASCFGFPPCSDPDSTALVIEAMVSAGQDPASALWTVGGNTPAGYLLTQQNADGGFGYSGPPSDPFTTSEVPLALLLLQQTSGVPAPAPSPTSTGGLTHPVSTAHPSATPKPQATASVAAVVTTATPESTEAATEPATPAGGVLGASTGPSHSAATPGSGGDGGTSWLLYLFAAVAGVMLVTAFGRLARNRSA